MTSAVRAFLSFGSNLGDRTAYLAGGVEALGEGIEVIAISPLYETAPVGGVPQDDFLNVVVEIDTTLEPEALLDRCQDLERTAERVRDLRFGPRTLDVDVLLYGGMTIETERLTVPHPRMWERRFVLAPLRDLAPELVPNEIFLAAEGDVVKIGML
ncbi:MAG: 2-amino-4-hydroxy-6-hydroxymethyldihydropteridine diphosphokinase [Actinomycetota bacterium]